MELSAPPHRYPFPPVSVPPDPSWRLVLPLEEHRNNTCFCPLPRERGREREKEWREGGRAELNEYINELKGLNAYKAKGENRVSF